ncbi:MAG: hypothetical protein GXY08_07790 [Ruminococcus sp.]|nr:hypothetical protein [Ruminococcus sp.]
MTLIYKAILIFTVSSMICFASAADLQAFAASGSSSSAPSKGVTAAVIIGLFVAVSIVSAIITYKIRMKGSGEKSDKDGKEE